jgi:hypothetical protein
MFLGVATIHDEHDWNWWFVILTILFCTVFRSYIIQIYFIFSPVGGVVVDRELVCLIVLCDPWLEEAGFSGLYFLGNLFCPTPC